MVNYSSNAIYTYVRRKVLDAFPSMYVTGSLEPIPPEGPAVRVYEINHYRPRRNVTLENDDEQWHVAFQAEVYSNLFNGHDQEAYDIMMVIDDAFRELLFIETSCTPVERANNRVARLVARYEKIVIGKDIVPEETEEP